MNPSHSSQNPREVFTNEGCGVWGGGFSSWSVLNGADNNCYCSPWKDEAMDTRVGVLGLLFVWWIFWVGFWGWFFFGPLLWGHMVWIWGLRVLFSPACVILVTHLPQYPQLPL